jgi:hypothetical protein
MSIGAASIAVPSLDSLGLALKNLDLLALKNLLALKKMDLPFQEPRQGSLRASPLSVFGKIFLRFFCERENFWSIFAVFL